MNFWALYELSKKEDNTLSSVQMEAIINERKITFKLNLIAEL